MVLRRLRRKGNDPADGVQDFWAWWAGAKDAVDAAIEARSARDIADELGARVDAVHPELEWELTPGQSSRHALVVSAAGNAEIRYLAQRWLLAGPPPDETWEYADARRPSWQAGTVMELADVPLPLDDLVVAAHDRGQLRLDVEVHHPQMHRLPEQAQVTLAFLSLDWLLGEDAVEQWIGSIDAVVARPDGARPATELPAQVQALAADDEEAWSVLEGGPPERPRLALVRTPHPRFEDLQRIDHVAVTAPYRPGDVGLPSDDVLLALRDLEDAAVGATSPVAVLMGHETSNGTRTLHLYSRDGEATARQLQPLVSAWELGRAKTKVTRDPGWAEVRHLS